MRSALYALAIAALGATAFSAYRVNYATKAALAELSGLQAEILREQEAITVLKAELAFLTAPERLAALRDRHPALSELRPLTAADHVAIEALPFPPPDAFWARAAPSAFMPAQTAEAAP